ncbi:MAG: hypothetical protein GKR87_09890 [Kiritimatiellae bacterium]|nr:hypothetical protein [Kiritimatiellia bacterium]
MTRKPIELLGGESIYCINEGQLKSAHKLAYENADTSGKIQSKLKELEDSLSRNERAALAFVVIDRLLNSSEESS